MGGIWVEEVLKKSYVVNQKTKAILINADPHYPTKILEDHQVVYCRQTPKEIVNQSCLLGGSTLRGRRLAMEKMLHTKSKLPIPVKPNEGIFLFPTRSPRSVYCEWISFFHVKQFCEIKGTQGSTVYFTDDSELHVPTSGFSVRRQMQLTGLAIATFYKNEICGRRTD